MASGERQQQYEGRSEAEIRSLFVAVLQALQSPRENAATIFQQLTELNEIQAAGDLTTRLQEQLARLWSEYYAANPVIDSQPESQPYMTIPQLAVEGRLLHLQQLLDRTPRGGMIARAKEAAEIRTTIQAVLERIRVTTAPETAGQPDLMTPQQRQTFADLTAIITQRYPDLVTTSADEPESEAINTAEMALAAQALEAARTGANPIRTRLEDFAVFLQQLATLEQTFLPALEYQQVADWRVEATALRTELEAATEAAVTRLLAQLKNATDEAEQDQIIGEINDILVFYRDSERVNLLGLTNGGALEMQVQITLDELENLRDVGTNLIAPARRLIQLALQSGTIFTANLQINNVNYANMPDAVKAFRAQITAVLNNPGSFGVLSVDEQRDLNDALIRLGRLDIFFALSEAVDDSENLSTDELVNRLEAAHKAYQLSTNDPDFQTVLYIRVINALETELVDRVIQPTTQFLRGVANVFADLDGSIDLVYLDHVVRAQTRIGQELIDGYQLLDDHNIHLDQQDPRRAEVEQALLRLENFPVVVRVIGLINQLQQDVRNGLLSFGDFIKRREQVAHLLPTVLDTVARTHLTTRLDAINSPENGLTITEFLDTLLTIQDLLDKDPTFDPLDRRWQRYNTVTRRMENATAVEYIVRGLKVLGSQLNDEQREVVQQTLTAIETSVNAKNKKILDDWIAIVEKHAWWVEAQAVIKAGIDPAADLATVEAQLRRTEAAITAYAAGRGTLFGTNDPNIHEVTRRYADRITTTLTTRATELRARIAELNEAAAKAVQEAQRKAAEQVTLEADFNQKLSKLRVMIETAKKGGVQIDVQHDNVTENYKVVEEAIKETEQRAPAGREIEIKIIKRELYTAEINSRVKAMMLALTSIENREIGPGQISSENESIIKRSILGRIDTLIASLEAEGEQQSELAKLRKLRADIEKHKDLRIVAGFMWTGGAKTELFTGTSEGSRRVSSNYNQSDQPLTGEHVLQMLYECPESLAGTNGANVYLGKRSQRVKAYVAAAANKSVEGFNIDYKPIVGTDEVEVVYAETAASWIFEILDKIYDLPSKGKTIKVEGLGDVVVPNNAEGKKISTGNIHKSYNELFAFILRLEKERAAKLIPPKQPRFDEALVQRIFRLHLMSTWNHVALASSSVEGLSDMNYYSMDWTKYATKEHKEGVAKYNPLATGFMFGFVELSPWELLGPEVAKKVEKVLNGNHHFHKYHYLLHSFMNLVNTSTTPGTRHFTVFSPPLRSQSIGSDANGPLRRVVMDAKGQPQKGLILTADDIRNTTGDRLYPLMPLEKLGPYASIYTGFGKNATNVVQRILMTDVKAWDGETLINELRKDAKYSLPFFPKGIGLEISYEQSRGNNKPYEEFLNIMLAKNMHSYAGNFNW